MAAPCEIACPPVCRHPFDRVLVSRVLAESTCISWTLIPSFDDPKPYTFTLLYQAAGHADADNWEEVGLPVVDTYYAVDSERRDWGVLTRAHYKIRLETGINVYESEPVFALGTLDKRGWLIVREAVRQRRLQYRKGQACDGFLLKRRTTGEPCPTCLDHQTGEPTDPACPDCRGTGWKCGYYFPAGCVYAQFVPRGRLTEQELDRGTTEVQNVRADMLATTVLETNDVWVDARTDERYTIVRIDEVAEVRGVPIAASVALQPLPFSSPIYDVPVPRDPSACESVPVTPPTTGDGSVAVDHNYGGSNALAVQTAEGVGISGAAIRAYRADDWAAGRRSANYAAAVTVTTTGGEWAEPLHLSPGNYMLFIYKQGVIASTSVPLTVS